jgi:dTDP-L-rhamnose 4-epimerase
MVAYGEGRYDCPEHGPVRPPARARADLERGRFEPRCPACGAELRTATVPESAPLDPRNTYAVSKVAQEQLAGVWAAMTGGAAIALRYHNVYGPRMPRDTPYAGVASIFRSALENGRAPKVFEDGRQIRDFVHVHDVAAANLLALAADPVVSGPFNVASGQPCTLHEMASALAAAFDADGLEPQIVGGYRLGDVRHVFGSTTRAERDLGYGPAVAYRSGLAQFARSELRA